MRLNHLLSCFKTLHVSHLSDGTVVPKSLSSVVLSDEHHHAASKMLAVSKDWFLEGDILFPTKLHLREFCIRVATLMHGDRVICFICSSPESVGSCSVSVHLSRIQTHGGKLMQLVLPNVSKSSTRLFNVRVQESYIGMLAISDYLYRSHINFSGMDLSDTIEVACTARRWECHDLFIGALLHIVCKRRLDRPFSLRATVSFRWLPEAPSAFIEYFRDRSDTILPSLTFPQLIDVLHSGYVTSTTQLCDQVLRFVVLKDVVQTSLDARLLLTLYNNEISIPLIFKEYFAAKIARFFFQLYSQRNVLVEDHEKTVELEYFSSTPYAAISKKSMINLLHSNNILFETFRRIDETTSEEYDSTSMFWTMLQDVEPLIPDKKQIIALMQRICAGIDDREGLLADESAWKELSPRGMRIAALSLCSTRSYSPSLQFSIHIPWESVRTGSSVNTAVGSIAGVKFELKARSTSDHTCSWRLYYSNVEGCFEPMTGLFVRVSYELVNSNCCCEDILIMEGTDKVKLRDKNFRNGSVNDLHTEGELTLFNEWDVADWCNRHQEPCILSIFVKIRL